MLQVSVGNQALILSLKRLDVPNILNRDRGDCRDGGYQLQVIFIETNIRHVSVEINHAERFTVRDQRHAQKRSRMRRNQAVGVQCFIIFGIGHQQGGIVFEYAPHNGAADGYFLIRAIHAIESEDRSEFVACVSLSKGQKNRAVFGRYDFEDQFEQTLLQFFEVANRVY